MPIPPRGADQSATSGPWWLVRFNPARRLRADPGALLRGKFGVRSVVLSTFCALLPAMGAARQGGTVEPPFLQEKTLEGSTPLARHVVSPSPADCGPKPSQRDAKPEKRLPPIPLR
jgi:hypothetical protein